MSETEYLMLIGKGDLRPLREKFKELRGFYTGFGWAFPKESETILSSIVADLPSFGIHKAPLAPGQSFEGHRQVYIQPNSTEKNQRNWKLTLLGQKKSSSFRSFLKKPSNLSR